MRRQKNNINIIVGLGNPGEEYKFTPHNMGFLVIDNLLKKIRNYKKFKTKYCIFYKSQKNNFIPEDIYFVKPSLFMNNSGIAIKNLEYRLKINNFSEKLLIIYDDINIQLNKILIKSSGTAAGHKGMGNIIDIFNDTNIKRIKLGINNQENILSLTEYVLTAFPKEDINFIINLTEKIADIVIELINTDSFENIMSKYNRKDIL